MRVILVDDEAIALKGLKTMLERSADDISIVGMTTDADQVVDLIMNERPNAVFLDIHMPEVNGMNLGMQIREADPNMEIIFVTGDGEYALRAFELYALDYVMKPIREERLRKTIQRLRENLAKNKVAKINENEEAAIPLLPQICCFDQIVIRYPDRELQSIKWRTNKVRELFAYLLHHRNRSISRDHLLELLWPEVDEMKAAQQLYTAIYHIRQVIKRYASGIVSLNHTDLELGYKMTIREATVDTEEWERTVSGLGIVGFHNINDYERALQQYSGDYYGEYEYVWAEHERERFRQMLVQIAYNMSRFYEQQNMLQEAVRVQLRVQHLLPYEENSYFVAMKLFDQMGDYRGVEMQYQLLIKRIDQELETTPDKSIVDWYSLWKEKIPAR